MTDFKELYEKEYATVASVWKALGLPQYDGKHISEHVARLRDRIEILESALKAADDLLVIFHRGEHNDPRLYYRAADDYRQLVKAARLKTRALS